MTWSLSQLKELAEAHKNWAVSEENGCLWITNEDGLEAWVAVSGEQIIAESILFARKQVRDTAGLNEQILKTHQLFPLTTVAITSINGDEYYLAFGALSAQSKAESIDIEICTLFDNVAGFLDAYEDYLSQG